MNYAPRRIGVFSLSLFILAGFLFSLRGQAQPPATKNCPPADKIIELAIDAQGARELKNELSDFALTAEIRVYIDGSQTETDVRQLYKVNDKFRREILDPMKGKDWQIKGYNGDLDLAWEEAKGRVRKHTGRSGHQDKKKIKEDLADLKRLLRYFFLANLPGDGVTFSHLEDRDQAGLEAHVVERRVSDEICKKSPGVEFSRTTLFIEKETYRLLGVEIPAEVTAKGTKLNVCFWDRVKDVTLSGQPARGRIWIPLKVDIYENDLIQSKSHLMSIKINSGLEEKLFQP